MNRLRLGIFGKLYINSFWFFPAIITLIFFVLTTLGVSGSSIGVYDKLFQLKETPIVNGEVRTVRSDEWLVTTPMTFAQKESNFPIINSDIGLGQDMSVVIDAPYRDWSIAFKPQNLGFFILPSSNAFAAKWWFMSYLLLIGSYTLFYSLYKKKLPSILLAIFILFNPFIQWWYQSITLLSIGYTFLILAIVINLLKCSNNILKILLSILTYYLLTCFALLMYPAFQIPLILIATVLFVAWYLSEFSLRVNLKSWNWLYVIIPVAISLFTVLLFLFQRRDEISTISNTIYPGQRFVQSGGEYINALISWPFNYLLLDDRYASILGTNQSEASSFFLIGLLIIPILLLILFRSSQTYVVDMNNKLLSMNLLIGCSIITILLMIRLYIPHTDLIFNILGFSSIPHERLRLALGLVSSIILIIAVVGLGTKKIILNKQLTLYLFIVATLSLLIVGFASQRYELFTVGHKEIIAVLFLMIITLFLLIHPIYKIRVTGLALATTIAVLSSFNVNPIYKGTGSLENSHLVNAISTQEKNDKSRWIVDDYFPMTNIPIVAGAESLSGTFSYPQMKLWENYFPGKESLFNRYATITFKVSDGAKDEVYLRQKDHIVIQVSSCSETLRKLDIKYIVSTTNNNPYRCFKKMNILPSESLFFIYQRTD